MFGNFGNCLPVTLGYEGGWSDHPKDPGGATMKGITLAVYRRYRPGASKADLRSISLAEVEAIYRAGYWSPLGGDYLPAGVDLATFDFGVNSGVSRAGRYLQAVVGVDGDGKVGHVTLAAVKAANPRTVVQALCAKRLSFLSALSTFSTFGKGWSRRVANVEARAVAMVLTNGAPITVEAKRALAVEAEVATAQARQQVKNAGGSAVGGSSAGGAVTVASAEPNWMLLCALGVFVIVALVVFVRRVMQHMERADAYAELAAA